MPAKGSDKPPGATRLLATAREVRTRHGTFTIGPASRFVAIDLQTELPHDAPNRVDGTLYTKAISLVTAASDYDPKGVLVWISRLGVYGSWDAEHLTLHVFPTTTLATILASPAKYLTTQWEGGGNEAWEHFPIATLFDLVPYRLDKVLEAAFLGTKAQRTAAVRKWRPLLRRYPSLVNVLDSAVHSKAVDIHNLITSEEYGKATKAFAAVDAYFGPLASAEALAEIERQRGRLRWWKLWAKLRDAGTARDIATFTRLLPTMTQIPDEQARGWITSEHVHNILFELVRDKHWEPAKRLLRSFIEVVHAIGYTRIVVTGANTSEKFEVHESIASFAVVIATVDPAFFALAKTLIPKRITYGPLAFNIACFHSLARDRKAMLRAIANAISVGKTTAEFADSDFDHYRDDRDFQRAIGASPDS